MFSHPSSFPMDSKIRTYSRECLDRTIRQLVEKYDRKKTIVYNETSNDTSYYRPHPLLFTLSLLCFTFFSSSSFKLVKISED